jgi:hypothetical protein
MSLVVYESISYKKLVADHPPHVIHTEEENETYIAELEALYSQEELTPEESEYAELLKVLIEKFESRYPGRARRFSDRCSPPSHGCSRSQTSGYARCIR